MKLVVPSFLSRVFNSLLSCDHLHSWFLSADMPNFYLLLSDSNCLFDQRVLFELKEKELMCVSLCVCDYSRVFLYDYLVNQFTINQNFLKKFFNIISRNFRCNNIPKKTKSPSEYASFPASLRWTLSQFTRIKNIYLFHPLDTGPWRRCQLFSAWT